MGNMRFRHIYMGVGSILVILLYLLSDPDSGIIENMKFGASTLATIIILSKTVLYTAILHISRRALIDYVDLKQYFDMAKRSPEGAGKAVIGVGLIEIAIAITIMAAISS